ncbi:hypothetical protein MX635_08395 [Carnobacterium divergens]|uniref:Uncharacterized protein n=1 Tax=Carnobacterium divergens TaxID=2748 RepID=A0AAW8R9G0_CARDV|nr:hypothetical protein [Carnobacterium divergens]MDT1974406.1 hypothetical protein [Carnobacterium divergens]
MSILKGMLLRFKKNVNERNIKNLRNKIVKERIFLIELERRLVTNATTTISMKTKST